MENLNNELVVQSMNYHGNDLTSFLKDLSVFRELNLTKVDYSIYQSRSKELRLEDRGRRLLVNRFISQNFLSLFRDKWKIDGGMRRANFNEANEETHAIVPPIETFFKTSAEDRLSHFYDLVTPQDILLCRVAGKSQLGLYLNILGFAPDTGKSRYVRDLKIKCFCPSAEILPDQVRGYETGDAVCVIVLDKDETRILVGMRVDSLEANEEDKKRISSYKIPLGPFTEKSLPLLYNYTEQVIDKRLMYDEVLRKNPGFSNPSNIEVLSEELGLSNIAGDSSLFPSLRHQFHECRKAKALKKIQDSELALKHIAKGIQYYREDNIIEAFGCVNQGLKIDPENVEGLVARGALYANRGDLQKATEDFEEALKHNPNHRNAKQYSCSTYLAIAKNCEKENDEDKAVETYEKILKIDPDHRDAKDALAHINDLKKSAEELGIDLKALGGKKEMIDKFKEFLKEQKSSSEKKKKRRDSSSEDDIAVPPFERKQNQRKSRSRSVSPFSRSQKLSMVNPEKILAPGAKSVVHSENIFDPLGESICPPGEEEDPIAAPASPPAIGAPVIGLPMPFFQANVPPPSMIGFSQENPEYLQQVAAFLSRNKSKDNLDDKIDQHLDMKAKRKRRTFTEYPVYDDNPAPGSSKETRIVKSTESQYEVDKFSGMLRRVTQVERVVKKVSRSPSPPPGKKSDRRSRSRDKSRRRSRSRERSRRRSQSREERSRRRSRSRHRSREHSRKRSTSRSRRRSRSRSRGERRRHHQKRSRSRSGDRHRNPHARHSDHQGGGLEALISETREIQHEREKIEREKAELLKKQKMDKSISQEKKLNLMPDLPLPVPLRASASMLSTEASKKERKEISMKLTAPKPKVVESDKWTIEDDDDEEEEELNNAMNTVQKALGSSETSSSSSSKKPLAPGKAIDPATASKILPGARSFKDIEAYLNAAKKDKLDKLKQKNKW